MQVSAHFQVNVKFLQCILLVKKKKRIIILYRIPRHSVLLRAIVASSDVA